MGVRVLAEAIILQSIEDLWDGKEKADAMKFFDGDGFVACAELAGMNFFEQLRLYNMVNRTVRQEQLKLKKTEKFLAPAEL